MEYRAKSAPNLIVEMGVQLESIERDRSIGFSPKELRWYGWGVWSFKSFGVGSVVKLGDVGYVPESAAGLIRQRCTFHCGTNTECIGKCVAECKVLPDGVGILVTPAPLQLELSRVPAELLEELGTYISPQGVIETQPYKLYCGRGEWQAETLEDARQMAIDFALKAC